MSNFEQAIKALQHLDAMANRSAGRLIDMSWDDIEDLCQARELLADAIGAVYNDATEQYEVPNV